LLLYLRPAASPLSRRLRLQQLKRQSVSQTLILRAENVTQSRALHHAPPHESLRSGESNPWICREPKLVHLTLHVIVFFFDVELRAEQILENCGIRERFKYEITHAWEVAESIDTHTDVGLNRTVGQDRIRI